jgi:hypothetical protein
MEIPIPFAKHVDMTFSSNSNGMLAATTTACAREDAMADSSAPRSPVSIRGLIAATIFVSVARS